MGLISDIGHLLLPNGDLVIVNIGDKQGFNSGGGKYFCKVKNLLNGEISQSQGLKVHVRGKSHFKKLQRIYGKDKSDFNELHAEFDSTILDDQPGDHVMPFPTLVNLLISDLQALDNQSLLELGLHTSRKSF